MKKRKDENPDKVAEMRDHYEIDYSKAKPNRFAEEFDENSVAIILDPDVAAAFPTTASVNEALRLVMKLSAIPTTSH